MRPPLQNNDNDYPRLLTSKPFFQWLRDESNLRSSQDFFFVINGTWCDWVVLHSSIFNPNYKIKYSKIVITSLIEEVVNNV